MKRVLLCSLAASAIFAMAASDADAASRKHHPKGHHYAKTWTHYHHAKRWAGWRHHHEWGYEPQWSYGHEWGHYAWHPTMVGDVPYQFSALNWGGTTGGGM